MDKKALSHLIGALLLVTITLLLSLTIVNYSSYFMKQTRTYVLAFTADLVTPYDALVTFHGGHDVFYMNYCKVLVDGKDTGVRFYKNDVGSTRRVFTGLGKVLSISCTFVDGTEQVVFIKILGLGVTPTPR